MTRPTSLRGPGGPLLNMQTPIPPDTPQTGHRNLVDYWATATLVCTPKQLRILQLREQHHFSLRLTAITVGVTVRTVRTQIDAAHTKINRALKEAA